MNNVIVFAFKLSNFYFQSYRKISKVLLAFTITGGVSYFINKHNVLINFHIPKLQPILSVYAASSRNDQINSFNFIADVIETITPSFVSITIGDSSIGISSGCGFIVDESGYILTNAHVIKNPYVSVALSDGQKFQAEVIAIDKTSNLALIKIDPGRMKLQALKFAEISKLRAGEFVIAFGSPIKLSNSVTFGIVSAVERDLGRPRGYKYVQTDAIITAGNSGGPLVNLYGEVIGVNTKTMYAGFGFAIPSNHCDNFVKLAMDNGRSGGSIKNKIFGNQSSSSRNSRKKCIGVIMGKLTPQMAHENKMSHPEYLVHPVSGVVIHSVFSRSPAHKSGILPGDIIESVNGIVVRSTAEFTSVIAKFDELDVTLIRKGQRLILKNVVPEFY